MTLREGKNREIRKIAEHYGCTVNRLIRISYGPFKLGKSEPGQVVSASEKEVKELIALLNGKK